MMLQDVLIFLVKVGFGLLLRQHIYMIIREDVGPLAERYFRWRNEQQRENERQAEAEPEAEDVRNAEPEEAHVPKRAKVRKTTYRRYKRRGGHANPRQRKARHAEERRRAAAAAARRRDE
ncbi:hypothetical protein BBK36DRAFT_1158806 [Trichoderma citrinoviride]|uniref:Uncharacterized protein n=1 Tax=Trichoderma citrinoviride TaxID=58853 RepID=A0A2T4BC02_9HYPO|nr:hypothetical protein BBK36DRAFT_1158806 [Trichoderma citrinoviride]PTB66854.1 hypothetical protein BBK36DRAFT_1158806 [Trichoderma citrinoviride]